MRRTGERLTDAPYRFRSEDGVIGKWPTHSDRGGTSWCRCFFVTTCIPFFFWGMHGISPAVAPTPQPPLGQFQSYPLRVFSPSFRACTAATCFAVLFSAATFAAFIARAERSSGVMLLAEVLPPLRLRSPRVAVPPLGPTLQGQRERQRTRRRKWQ
jgi:hypothetical protein